MTIQRYRRISYSIGTTLGGVGVLLVASREGASGLKTAVNGLGWGAVGLGMLALVASLIFKAKSVREA